ncbi:MAG: sensor histidine kinase [Lachnospiraceae bacterium]|nr:sensor histidine kinase [Lachnospiraceae bacterium]
MKHIKQIKTIRAQLGIYYGTFLCILLAAVAASTIYLMGRSESENIRTYSESILRQTSDSIDSELKNYETGLKIINNSALLQEFAKADHTEDAGEEAISIRRESKLFNAVTDIKNTLDATNSVGVFLTDGAKGYFLGNATSPAISAEYLNYVHQKIKSMPEKGDGLCWAGPVRFQGIQSILLLRNIVNNQNLENLGHLAFNIDLRQLEQMLRETEIGREKAAFITDAKGQLVAASDDALYQQWREEQTEDTEYGQQRISFDGAEYLRVSCQSEYTGWNIIGLIPMETLQKQLFVTRTTILMIDIAGIILSLLITVLIARHLARPIERLRSSMQEISKQGSLDVAYEDDTCYETRELGKSFIKMLQDIDELVIKNGESELREKEAQLCALQAQINPHFLYNTLNTINYMLILEDKPEISQLVVNLGDLLRSSIDEARGLITLEEEVNLVEKYLYIQKARFEDKLNYEITVSEEARRCMVIRLLLQPLVENSIIHGVMKNGGSVWIQGSVDRENNLLVITVEDNGQGMTEEETAFLLVKKRPEKNGRKHIGAANVNQRIQLYYGKEYGIKVESRKNEGTKIRIELPAQWGTENEDEDIDRR